MSGYLVRLSRDPNSFIGSSREPVGKSQKRPTKRRWQSFLVGTPIEMAHEFPSFGEAYEILLAVMQMTGRGRNHTLAILGNLPRIVVRP